MNARTRAGSSALMFAALSGKFNATSALLRAGADVSLQDQKGLTALMAAAARGHGRIVQLLLSRSASVLEQRDVFERTALLHAVEAGHAAVVDCLVAHGSPLPRARYAASRQAWEHRARFQTDAAAQGAFVCT